MQLLFGSGDIRSAPDNLRRGAGLDGRRYSWHVDHLLQLRIERCWREPGEHCKAVLVDGDARLQLCRPIGVMRFCFCAAPSYLASAPPLQVPADLPRHRHLGFKFPATDRRYIPTLTRGDEHFTLDHPPAMYFNSGSATAAAVVAGLGVAFLPRAEAEVHIRSGHLVEVLSDWQMGTMPMSFVYPPTRALSARVRAFADWVTALMAEDPVWAPVR